MPVEPGVSEGGDGGPGILAWSNPWAEPPTYIGNNAPFGRMGRLDVYVSDPPPVWATNFQYDRVIVSLSSVYASPITVSASVFGALGVGLGDNSIVLTPSESADMSIYLSGQGGNIESLALGVKDEYETGINHACVLNDIRFPGGRYWTAVLGCEESA